MAKLTDRDTLIKILEEHEELRLRFYDTILSHLVHVHTWTKEKGMYHTLELRGLYKSQPTDKVKNNDYEFLYNLVWEDDEEDRDEIH